MESKLYKFCKCLAIAFCLVEMLVINGVCSARNQPKQTPRTQPKADSSNKFEFFKTTNDLLVLLPPGVNLTESQTRNCSIKLSADSVFNQRTRMETYGDLGLDEQVDTEQPRSSGARESRKVGLLRGLWNKPRISPLYLVNGTVCRFVNSAPICTTLTTTGIMPAANSTTVQLPAFSRGGLDSLIQLPSNQQLFPNNQQQQQFPNNQQQQFPNNQQQQFPNNQQQSPINQQQQQQQTRPIG